MVNKDFFLALDDLEREKKINKEFFIEALESALTSAYKKNFGEAKSASVKLNPEKNTIKVYSYKTVVKKGDLILTLSKKDGSSIEVFADDTLEYYLNNESEVKVNYDGITKLTNDLKKGDYLGIYSIYADDRLLYSKEIFLSEDVINRNSIIISLIIVITGCIGIISLKKKRS